MFEFFLHHISTRRVLERFHLSSSLHALINKFSFLSCQVLKNLTYGVAEFHQLLLAV